jgi:hypothetical protein
MEGLGLEIGGFVLGACVVAVCSVLADNNPNRSDYEELNAQLHQAIEENESKNILLASISAADSELIINRLQEQGITASRASDYCVRLDFSRYLSDDTTEQENVLYSQLIKSNIILSPSKDRGVFFMNLSYHTLSILDDIIKKIKVFFLLRAEKKTTIDEAEAVEELKQPQQKEELEEQIIAEVPDTSSVKAVPLTIKSRKRRTIASDEINEATSTTHLEEQLVGAIDTPRVASSLKTPSRKRSSIAKLVDEEINGVDTTVKKSRRRKVE